jgi:hypothetical protein
VTFPDDFAAEWRAEERRRKAVRLAKEVISALLGDFLGLTEACDETRLILQRYEDAIRRYHVAAQAERLSAWGPWR